MMPSISALLYDDIYIWLIVLLSIAVFSQYNNYNQSRVRSGGIQPAIGVLLLALFLVLFVGFRPINAVFADMVGYYNSYVILQGDTFYFNWDVDNIIFDNYYLFLSSNSIPVEFFFLSISAVYFVGIAFACSRFFPNDRMTAFLVYLGALSTFSYATNGIKAGAAASLFLVALAFYENRRWPWTILFILLSLGFHHSMILPVLAFLVCIFVKNPKWYFALWIVCFIIAMFHITVFQQLFAGYAEEQALGYLMGSEETVRHDILGGFRIDFILYSVVPIFFGWYAIYRKKIRVTRNYIFLLNLYTLTNAIWMLCMYAEFTNRISYLSWLMLPIVLIYPFLKENWGARQYQTFLWVAFGHLAFTLFMQYIYY